MSPKEETHFAEWCRHTIETKGSLTTKMLVGLFMAIGNERPDDAEGELRNDERLQMDDNGYWTIAPPKSEPDAVQD